MPLFDMIIDVLREAGKPLPLLEIVHALQLKHGIPEFEQGQLYDHNFQFTNSGRHEAVTARIHARMNHMLRLGITVPQVLRVLNESNLKVTIDKRIKGQGNLKVVCQAWGLP